MINEVGKSAIADHFVTTGHTIDFPSSKVIHSFADSNKIKRKIGEALIMKSRTLFTSNIPSYKLDLFD